MKRTITLLFLLSALGVNKAHAQSNNSLAFDGIDDKVTATGASSLIANSTAMSLTMWVNPANAAPTYPNYDGFAGFRNNTDADFYILQLTSTSVEARLRGSNGTAYDLVTPVLTINQWVHLALTYDASMLRLYKNGILVDSVAASDVITSTTEDFLIGDLLFQGTNFYLTGKVDEVSLWNRKLSAEELACMPSNGIDTANATGLQLYYRCNQGTASGSNTSITALTDDALHINGTLSGFALSGSASNFVTGASQISTAAAFKCPDVPYVWNGISYASPGVYYDTLTNQFGCDSIVQLTLNSIVVDTGVTQNGSQLTANHTGIYYQWLDCNNNYAPIAGATSKVYNATAIGSYAVIIQQSNCYDTSNCHVVTAVGLNDDLFSASVSVFPTVTTDLVNIDLGVTYSAVNIQVSDISGRIIIAQQLHQVNKHTIDFSALSHGVYQLTISTDSGRKSVRLVKE